MALKYFAYGEKMYSPLLYSIVKEAICLGIGKVRGYKLYFHNRGQEDLSGKCNIIPVIDQSCEVYGVVYEVPSQARHLLDKAEGLGYGQQEMTLKIYPANEASENSTSLDCFAFTYIANKENVFEDLVPFTWYKEMVIIGAKEHRLPPDYIHHLEQYAAMPDPNIQRANKHKRYLEEIDILRPSVF